MDLWPIYINWSILKKYSKIEPNTLDHRQQHLCFFCFSYMFQNDFKVMCLMQFVFCICFFCFVFHMFCASLDNIGCRTRCHSHSAATRQSGTKSWSRKQKSGFQEHKECAASSFQGCFDLVAATPETRRERCGASITLLCNKSGQIAVFFLNDPFLGGAIFCGASWRGAAKKRPIGNCSCKQVGKKQGRGRTGRPQSVSCALYRRRLWWSVQSGVDDSWRWI